MDNTYNNYHSAMNYNYQMNTTDYSNGQNGSNDHNDWGILQLSQFASANDSGNSYGDNNIHQNLEKNNRPMAGGVSLRK
ncbi:MAG: hypothetical protein ACREGB_03550, partial [Candidatus Saccharimonadales bacterium]